MRGALSWPDALREGRSAALRRVPSHVMARPITARHSPACDAPRILPAKPSDQISSNAKAAARVTGHDRGPRPNPRSAFRIWNSVCSFPPKATQPNQPSHKTRRAHPVLCRNVRRIVMAGYALRREGQQSSIAPHRTLWRARSRPAHNPPHEHACSAARAAFLRAHDISLTQAAPAQRKRPVSISPKRKNHRAIPAFLRDCAAVRHIDYAFASVSMAWANILTLSMNFSQSTYSSGIWQVSTSPGKLMPNATVLGIMRE